MFIGETVSAKQMITMGTKRGTWTVVERFKKEDKGRRCYYFLCRCECGKEKIRRSSQIADKCDSCSPKLSEPADVDILEVYKQMLKKKDLQ